MVISIFGLIICIMILGSSCLNDVNSGQLSTRSETEHKDHSEKGGSEENASEISTEMAKSIPILLYHNILPQNEIQNNANGVTIAVEEFQNQMNWLNQNGYITPTLSQFVDWLDGEKVLPKRSVLITFDDGYSSVKDYALPILQENDFTAVVFIIGKLTDEPDLSHSHFDWDDIVAIQESQTLDFQSHTYDGHDASKSGPDILSWLPKEFSDDLCRLEDCFVEHNLNMPWAFAYPFGVVNDSMVEVLLQRDYRLAFTTEYGSVKQNDDCLRLKRVIIWPGTDIEMFERRIGLTP